MDNKLMTLKRRYEELGEYLSSPDAIQDRKRWQEAVRERSSLEEIVEAFDEYAGVRESLAALDEMYSEADSELRELIHEERAELNARADSLTERLKVLLLPKDPNDDRNVMIEIRAGTGGDEAALFGAVLLRMYQRYAERKRYGAELISGAFTEMGGVKEAVLAIKGRGAYSKLKFESGVHRVQRVPETESQGRVHTSAATVAVLPEADDVEIELNMSDLRIDTYRSSGAGGQHVNKTESAIRITHIPTGLVVQCQDEKSQLKNKEQALRVLRTRLFEMYRAERDAKEASARKSLVGSGDRSERIRTYNFPQNRVTDHRIGLTVYKLDAFIDGDIDEIVDALILAERTRLLAGEGE
ncbi:MAG: peptide chain release factor 1 [Clostridia bacterium]|nr:peptide chain release factor 1 [Clostridia bacterium]